MGISKEFFDELIAYIDAGDDISDDNLEEVTQRVVDKLTALEARLDALEKRVKVGF